MYVLVWYRATLPSNKSSRRRLNTGSGLTSRQEATPASAEEIHLPCEETPLSHIMGAGPLNRITTNVIVCKDEDEREADLYM